MLIVFAGCRERPGPPERWPCPPQHPVVHKEYRDGVDPPIIDDPKPEPPTSRWMVDCRAAMNHARARVAAFADELGTMPIETDTGPDRESVYASGFPPTFHSAPI